MLDAIAKPDSYSDGAVDEPLVGGFDRDRMGRMRDLANSQPISCQYYTME